MGLNEFLQQTAEADVPFAYAALAELSADHQMLLIGKYMEGVPAAQLAAEAGKSEQAIRSKLARARRAFRGAFVRIAGRGDRPEVRE